MPPGEPLRPAGKQKPEAVLEGRTLQKFANDVFCMQKVDVGYQGKIQRKERILKSP